MNVVVVAVFGRREDGEIDAEEIANSKYNQRNYNSEGRGRGNENDTQTEEVPGRGRSDATYLIHISAFHDDGKKGKKKYD